MGVANAVKEEGLRFAELVLNVIRTGKGKKDIVADGVIKQTYGFTETVMGKEFAVSLIYYNFLTREAFEDNSEKINCNSAAITSDGKRYRHLFIVCYGISGGVDESSLRDSIYHELSHYYQGISGNGKIFENDPKYATAAFYMKSDKEYERNVALLYYYSKRFEGDGYINGLYGALTASGEAIPKYENIEGTDAYIAVTQFKYCLNNVSENSNNKDYEEFCHSKFGVTLFKLLKIAYASYYRFTRNIGRVLIKVRQDKINEGVHFGVMTNGKEVPLII